MRKILSLFLCGFVVFSLSGCGTAQLRDMPGNSIADITLKRDVAKLVLLFPSANCSKSLSFENIINTRVVSPPSADGVWQEIWTVEACDKVSEYKVSFRGDGQGGTSFSVKYSPPQ